MSSHENVNIIRYELLDVARFIAAFSVVMYHFVFQGWSYDPEYLNYEYGDFWKYGFLGVQFFFIISGFVVFMSAKNKSIAEFISSRISRLFPAYWMCVLTTFLLVWLLNTDGPTFFTLLVNLTMLEGFVKVPYVDPVYWSLTYELIFYFWISCYLFFKCRDEYFKVVLFCFLVLSSLSYFHEFPNLVIVIFQTVYAPYFIAGICLYKLTEEKGGAYVVLLLWCYILSVVQVNQQLAELSAIDGVSVSNSFSVAIVSLIYFSFVLLVFRFFKVRLSWSSTLGALTYPLYLIHGEIGGSLFEVYGNQSNKHLLLIFIVAVSLLFSFFVNKYVEKVYSPKLRIHSEFIFYKLLRIK